MPPHGSTVTDRRRRLTGDPLVHAEGDTVRALGGGPAPVLDLGRPVAGPADR
jgi:hypothetical protein